MITPEDVKDGTKEVTAGAAGVGTPIYLVGALGAVEGFSAAGITSGLAALGFGSMLCGLGMVVVVGGAAYLGTKALIEVFE